jgi:hypothetical protein
MSIQLQIEQMPGYLAARFTGAGAAEEIWRQFESIAEHCKRTKNKKILIDLTRAEGKISTLDKFQMGESGRIFALHGIKVAGVDTPERIDPQGFVALVAQNRWVKARAFSNVEDAEEWLSE